MTDRTAMDFASPAECLLKMCVDEQDSATLEDLSQMPHVDLCFFLLSPRVVSGVPRCRGGHKDTVRSYLDTSPWRICTLPLADEGTEVCVYELALFAAHGSLDVLDRDVDFLRRALDRDGMLVLAVHQVDIFAGDLALPKVDREVRIHYLAEAAIERAAWRVFDDAFGSVIGSGTCPKGHRLQEFLPEARGAGVICDRCERQIGTMITHRCWCCNFDVCAKCVGHSACQGDPSQFIAAELGRIAAGELAVQLRETHLCITPEPTQTSNLSAAMYRGLLLPPDLPRLQCRWQGRRPRLHESVTKWERCTVDVSVAVRLRRQFVLWLQTYGVPRGACDKFWPGLFGAAEVVRNYVRRDLRRGGDPLEWASQVRVLVPFQCTLCQQYIGTSDVAFVLPLVNFRCCQCCQSCRRPSRGGCNDTEFWKQHAAAMLGNHPLHALLFEDEAVAFVHWAVQREGLCQGLVAKAKSWVYDVLVAPIALRVMVSIMGAVPTPVLQHSVDEYTDFEFD
mmetsp:Transcript_3070/g.6103  ORF Transcript_3070/g.6103 Transcript_3070/m.6103 type:complete len:507 (-) Transcript_3070:172-1692(-)